MGQIRSRNLFDSSYSKDASYLNDASFSHSRSFQISPCQERDSRKGLFEVLSKIKLETEMKYSVLKETQRQAREKLYFFSIMNKNINQLSDYQVCSLEKLILDQQRIMKKSLLETKSNVLNQLGISAKELEIMIKDHQNEGKITQVLDQINSPSLSTGKALLPAEELLKIVEFQAAIIESVGLIFNNFGGQKKKTIVNVVVSDLTYFEFQCDRDEVNYGFQQNTNDASDILIQDFRKAFSKINSVLSSIQ